LQLEKRRLLCELEKDYELLSTRCKNGAQTTREAIGYIKQPGKSDYSQNTFLTFQSVSIFFGSPYRQD
jgi:hypothetical protein